MGLAMTALAIACSHLPAPRAPEKLSVAKTWLEGSPRVLCTEPCTVETWTVDKEDMKPGKRFGDGGEYEVIGFVEIHAERPHPPPRPGAMVGSEGYTPPTAVPHAELELARPQACHIGGEVILAVYVNESFGDTLFERDTLCAVWAKRHHP